ncbi:MAG TPA: diacylglycerol kinase family protein [Polyangia bacterium]|nr:diacylglycerol kinase family protein [Polyangia bacterium]
MAGASRGGIAVFVNPRSRANRRDPALARTFATIIGDVGQIHAPASLDELRATAAALRAAPPDVIAVHGGDGTLHKVVTALGHAFGETPLPPLALLTGGTMNVVATSLGIAAKPFDVLRMLADHVRAGAPSQLLPLIPRRCMRIGEHLGFVFGNGLAANFLGEYYADDAYGPKRAAWLLARTFFSALVRGPFMRKVFKRFEGEVRVDGDLLPRTRFVGVNAATVREVGLGFKLNHRADDDPDRFGVLAIHGSPLALVADLPAVHAGRGVGPARAFSAVASTLDITPTMSPRANDSTLPTEMAYTIDGDLYRSSAPVLRLSVGPRIHFVRPSASVLRAARAPELLSAAPGDTMEAAR